VDTKDKNIEYWINQSKMDWDRAYFIIEKEDFVFGLFCVHLSLEKICKAIWVKQNNEKYPPRSHDLKYLLADTDIELTASQSRFIDDIQRYQIEGRYPDYKQLIYKYTTKELTDEFLTKANDLRECLLKEI
jgi:HEPN domain-containing protein